MYRRLVTFSNQLIHNYCVKASGSPPFCRELFFCRKNGHPEGCPSLFDKQTADTVMLFVIVRMDRLDRSICTNVQLSELDRSLV